MALLGTDVDVNRALSSFNQIKELGIVFTVVGCLLLSLVLLQWIVWSHNKDMRLAARLAMEESMLELNRQLLETDRLKTEFIESVSHELRGPVTAVNGAMQVLDQHVAGGLDEDGTKLMDIAITGTGRMVDLVNNLLDMTRIEAGGVVIQREKSDVRLLVNNTVKLFGAVAGEKGLDSRPRSPEMTSKRMSTVRPSRGFSRTSSRTRSSTPIPVRSPSKSAQPPTG